MSLRSFLFAAYAAAIVLSANIPLTSAADAPHSDPLDWPMWRGPEQNGISRETGLVDKWEMSGTNVLWKSEALGTRSTPIVLRGKLYTLARSEPGTHREGEKVMCADAATGKVLWENKFNVFLSDVPDTRVGWSCCVGDPETGNIYAMGVCGYFQCIDGETGQTLWKHSLSEEFGLLSTYGGRTNVPIIHEDLVIISAVITGWGDMSRPAHRFVAMDKRTGEVVWLNGTRLLPDDTTYSTPILATLDGQAAMVFGSGDGSVWAMQPRTGLPIWNYRFSLRGVNLTPVIDSGIVYMGQSEENRQDVGVKENTMGAVVAINGAAATGGKDITEMGEVWRNKEVMVGRAGMVLVDGRLYGADDSGNLYIFNAKTGEQVGKRQKLLGTIMRASLLAADGKIYACSTSAWHVLQPTETGVKIVHRLRLPGDQEVHGSPIISHGKLYLPTTGMMYCLGNADAKPAATPIPTPPQEAPKGAADKPTHAQLVPIESLIKPGEKVNFKVRLFNERGQLLEERAAAKFAVEGPGQIDAEGVYTADSVPAHSGVVVKATVDGITGSARIRVVPPLPWKFDFSDGQVPVTWIGARYRHIVREVDGNPVLVKVTTIPKGTRSQSWMGHPDLHDYTVQADVRGSARADGKMPDIGLIAQRYTLDLMGKLGEQQLQLRTWTPQLERFSATTPLAWKPDTWYTLKMRASVEDGKAVLRGKVWERGQQEPTGWIVEATDEAPNTQGSPGLFGNATDAEIFIDNITVTPN